VRRDIALKLTGCIDPSARFPYMRALLIFRAGARLPPDPIEALDSMANNPGAKKSIRKIARRTEVNKSRRSRVRTYLRKFEESLVAGDVAVAKAAFTEAQSELMRAVSKGVVHKNTGARKVSRLAARLKKLAVA
jgi:small subunit ribosomal protein S20